MKKLFLLIATLLTHTAKSQTSVYHPFPDSGAVWTFRAYKLGLCPTGGSNYSIINSGDTSIGGQAYHKLSIPYIQPTLAGSCPPNIFSGYFGALRQDTTIRKVFFYPPSDSVEHLLYDFNLQVGDTVRGLLEPYFGPLDTVYSIDSVQVGNSFRKRWNINFCHDLYLIEGIGSTYGMTMSSPPCGGENWIFSLICFTQNGTISYPDSTPCEIFTNAGNIYQEENLITVFPNPFSEKLNFVVNENGNSEIILYDISSRKLLQQKFTNTASLNTELLARGLYIYEVRNSDGSWRKGKVVKD